jgi:hypothetical protein
MRFSPVALILSAVVFVIPALTAGCTGDDNTLPLPPSDGGSDAGDGGSHEGGDATSAADDDAAHEAAAASTDGPPGDAPGE